jgi:transcriptional regulator with XRE-family HTH domain
VGGAESLRRLRKSANLTLEQLAGRFGYSISHLSNVERGVKQPSEQLLRQYGSLMTCDDTRPGMPVIPAVAARSVAPVFDHGRHVAADDFGTRHMRLRLQRGWSLTQMQRRTGISRSYLGNLETGGRTPSPRIAEICDTSLNADGSLIALGDARRGRKIDSAPAGHADRPALASASETADPEQLLARSGQDLLQLRRVAQCDRPSAVLPALTEEAQALASQASITGGALSRDLWMAAARFAELAGWMAQEAADDDGADRWTLAATRLAGRAGDRDMGSYLWERRALVMLYRADGPETVRLAQRGAAARSASARVRGLAHRREAQGHALAGDADACRRSLDLAAKLIAHGPAPYPNGHSWGPNSIGDSSNLVEASCLVDLGRHHAAAELFGHDPVDCVPVEALRTRTRFAARAAMAFAGAGEVGLACAMAENLLPEAVRVDSATIRADLRRLLRLLSRNRRRPGVCALIPDLYNVVRGC